MAYIKLTSKLRRMMDELNRYMRASGFRADLRWMEQNPGVCPLCGESGGRAATISAVQVAEAGMVYIPYSVCETCVAQHYDFRQGSFGAENIEKIEARIFEFLGLSREQGYWEMVPEQFRGFINEVQKRALRDGFAFNPVWLQNHIHTCPSCAQTEIVPVKGGISVAGGHSGPPVMIPFLLCEACSGYSDEVVNTRVAERLLAAVNARR